MVADTVEFSYTYKNVDSVGTSTLTYLIELPFTECTNELAHRIVADKMDPVMSMIEAEIDLKPKLAEFIKEANQRYYDQIDKELIDKAHNGDIDLEQIIRNIERKYKDEVLEHAEKRDCPTDDEIFAQSFNRLVHSAALPDIIEKERSYAKVISEMTGKMERELDMLNDRHEYEVNDTIKNLGNVTNAEDVNRLLNRQYASHSMLKQKWESELESFRGFQKHEFRNWIVDETVKLQSIASNDTNQTPLGNKSLSMFVAQQPSMEESFTIHLGSQLKHNHNIRVLSAKVEDLCGPLHEDESLNGLNAALGLYSSSLCGVVVLTPSGFVKANEDIIKNANKSTEFHFDQVDRQIEKIQNDLNTLLNSPTNSPGQENLSKLKPGDFFITRHSNISTHIIFHLISDETHHSPNEINSRHPVILGLRNIIRTCTRYDITTLTIPALLRHEMTEDMTVLWCMRRAELVFKCAKGFMIESSSWGGSELSTLQLLLPHNISQDLFQNLTGIIPTVFRVANAKVLKDDDPKNTN